jgi:hypothetical protein
LLNYRQRRKQPLTFSPKTEAENAKGWQAVPAIPEEVTMPLFKMSKFGAEPFVASF